MVRFLPLSVVLVVFSSGTAWAQFGQPTSGAIDPSPDNIFETGFKLEVAGAASGVTATFPVPTDWEDQKAELIEQQLEPQNASLRFVDLNGTRQARVTIPRLAAGQTASVLLRYRVDRDPIVPPAQPQQLKLVETNTLPREQRSYLLPSPFIESRDEQIVTLAESLGTQEQSAWEQAKAFYDFVHQNVTYENGPMKGALAALAEKRGDCEEMTTLFVALCRARDIPARTVWVPGHCYPEFLVRTPDDEHRWVAVEMTNNFPFGQSPERRPILQKGDNFRIPGNRQPQHYVKQELTIRDYKGASPPVVQWLPPPGKEPPTAIAAP